MERDADVNPRTASMLALLAINQGEPSFAMEILGAVRAHNLTTIQNIRAICYAEMGRVEEAINVVHLLADQPPIDNDRRRVFPLVLQYTQKAAEKSKDENLKSRFEDLSKFVSQNNRLSAIDLTDFMNEPIHRRGAILPTRQGAQQAGGNIRDTGYQRSNTIRQGYNRDNRYVNEYLTQQSIQSSLRSNRERVKEKNVSQRSGNKPGPISTTPTSPIPQRSTRNFSKSSS